MNARSQRNNEYCIRATMAISSIPRDDHDRSPSFFWIGGKVDEPNFTAKGTAGQLTDLLRELTKREFAPFGQFRRFFIRE